MATHPTRPALQQPGPQQAQISAPPSSSTHAGTPPAAACGRPRAPHPLSCPSITHVSVHGHTHTHKRTHRPTLQQLEPTDVCEGRPHQGPPAARHHVREGRIDEHLVQPTAACVGEGGVSMRMIFAANACPLRASAPSPSPPSPPAPTSAPPLQWPPLTPHWPFPTHQQPMRRGGPTPAAATRRLCTSLCCVCGGRVHGGRVLKGWGVCGSRRGWEYAVRTPAARAGPLPVLRTFRASCGGCWRWGNLDGRE